MAPSPSTLARGAQYLPAIKSAAAAANVPWWLLAAIVAVESGFAAKSYRAEPQLGKDRFGKTVASYGLVQILPDTAIAAGIPLTDSTDLYDVGTNLRAGAAYLASLRGKGDGTWDGIASLYNGGSGRKATTPTRFCLEWKPSAPTDRSQRTLDRDCARIYTAKAGQYLNQPYVDQVASYAAAFQAINSGEDAIGAAVDAVQSSPKTAIALLVAVAMGLWLWKGSSGPVT